jgi:hypothetical protein
MPDIPVCRTSAGNHQPIPRGNPAAAAMSRLVGRVWLVSQLCQERQSSAAILSALRVAMHKPKICLRQWAKAARIVAASLQVRYPVERRPGGGGARLRSGGEVYAGHAAVPRSGAERIAYVVGGVFTPPANQPAWVRDAAPATQPGPPSHQQRHCALVPARCAGSTILRQCCEATSPARRRSSGRRQRLPPYAPGATRSSAPNRPGDVTPLTSEDDVEGELPLRAFEIHHEG